VSDGIVAYTDPICRQVFENEEYEGNGIGLAHCKVVVCIREEFNSMNARSISAMLVDDSRDDNFFHERAIKKNNSANVVTMKTSAMAAIEHLKLGKDEAKHPDVIFLDINMPAMNGWEFIEEFSRLAEEFKGHAKIVMLTHSVNPDDAERAKKVGLISDYRIKPLTPEIVEEVIIKHVK
jgi:CheY-like chemotaxis protein